MKTQFSSNLVAALVFIGIPIAIFAFVVVMYIKYHNMGVNFEKRLDSTWQENKVVLNTYTAKVQEVAQVPAMMKDDLSQIIEQTFQGRYGENGSQAVFQFIQEQNLNLDPQLYRQIQQVMESGRNDFQTSQKVLIDVKMNYQAALDYFWSGLWLGIAGYPKLDLSKYNIVTLSEVEAKFESGQDSVIKLR